MGSQPTPAGQKLRTRVSSAACGGKKLFLAVLLLINIVPFPAGAQIAHPSFRHYTSDHGLPSSEVHEILQDRRGYLWFGTDNGISRFNGYEFQNFGASEGLKNNVVFALFEDPRGRIWINTMSRNLFYYDYDQDSILTYEHNSVIQSFPSIPIMLPAIVVDSAGTVSLTVPDEGILLIRPDGSYRLIHPNAPQAQMLLRQGNHYFFSRMEWPAEASDTTTLLIGTEDNLQKTEIFRLNKYQGRPYFLYLTEEKVFLNYGEHFYLFKNDQLSWYYQVPEFNAISALKTDSGAILLGGLYQMGVRIYSNEAALQANRFSTLLQGYSITHIYQDRDGGFWFATVEDGVFYAPNLEFLVYDQGIPQISQPFSAIVPLDERHIIAAHQDGELYLLDNQKNQLSKWYAPTNPATGREIFDLAFDPLNQVLWAAVTEVGIMVIPLSKGGPIRPLEIDTNLSVSASNLHFSAPTQTLEVATNKGFLVVDAQRQKLLLNSSNLAPRVSERITSIFRDRQKRLWVGKMNGLYQMKDQSLLPVGSSHPSLSLRVEAMAELPDSTLVVGTKGAGILFWKEGLVREISPQNGLTSGMVENLHVDAAGTLWVGTLNGLNKISFPKNDSLKIEQFTMADGLPSNEIRDITSIGRQIWVATPRGVVKLPLENPKGSTLPPPTLVSIQSNGKVLIPQDGLIFTHDQNNLHISFLTIDFRQPGRVRYRYRLKPNAGWTSSYDRSLTYPALPPGDFSFEVQAQSSDGQWSPSSSFSFTIRPPLWYNLWFWGIVLFLLSLTGYGFYRRRVSELQEKARLAEVQASLEREMNALEGAALRAQINPHFIANSLNAIQGLIVSEEKIAAMRYLSTFHQLLRRTLDLSRNPLVSLEEDIALLKIYLDLEKMRFQARFEYTIELDEALDLFKITIPPLLVQPYVENAVLHGFPPEVDHPRINIHYRLEGDQLIITITDNGIGISEAQRRQAEKMPAQSFKSYGMEVPPKRLALLGRGTGGNRVEIEEYNGKEGKIAGTRVRIVIDI